jgi:hypothetical protein
MRFMIGSRRRIYSGTAGSYSVSELLLSSLLSNILII